MHINNNSSYDTPGFFPSFHTMSTKIGTNRKFVMHIRQEDINATNMVSKHVDLKKSKLHCKQFLINI
jgi:hypothetical protein